MLEERARECKPQSERRITLSGGQERVEEGIEESVHKRDYFSEHVNQGRTVDEDPTIITLSG